MSLPAENVREITVPQPPVRRSSQAVSSPIDIVQAALKSGNVEMYREAVALFKELESMAARKAFDNAMADAVFPIIQKNRVVDFTSTKGRTHYKHEDLAEVLRTVVPILSANGLSHRFRVSSAPNEPVTVTCIISHRDGYFEETTLHAGRDESGNKNSIQAVGSTLTYLQRMSLKAALGLAASEDDDGRGAGTVSQDHGETPAAAGAISDAQVDEINDLLEAREVNRSAFLQWAKQKRVVDIPAEHYDSCIAAINKFKPRNAK